jgi:hypothetical protein
MTRVFTEIFDELIAREIFGVTAGNGVVSEARESSHRVEVETVVAAGPRASQRLVLFENDRLDPTPPERARGGQTRCSPADDDNRGFRHAPEISKDAAQYKINFTPATISTSESSRLNVGGGARLLP